MQLFFSHCAVFNCTLSEVSDYVHEDCNFFFFFFFFGGGGGGRVAWQQANCTESSHMISHA